MLQKFIAVLAVIFFLIPSLVSGAGKAAEKPQVIKLERFRKALWKVHVTVKGKPGDFLLDTGGGVTFLSEDFSKGVECKFWGRNTGYNMFGKRSDSPHCDNVQINAGDVALTPVNVGKIDFGDQFAGDKKPDGLLSLDAFDGKAITLDQKAGTLTIETPASLIKRTRTMKELPFRISRDCSARCLSVFVGVPTREGMTWLILDSGAGGVSLISKDHAKLFGLDPEAKEQRFKYEIAPGVPVDSPVVVTDMIMDGNLGQPFMSQYVITFDLANGRLWLARAG
ncbi:MAG TPA: aspartyl protease family protein [Pyrinomonadaceae bacterium]|nr:aspartyl protease family protein [Pyrinomonadaceae bacterium]